jgi:CxxC motif-containing protein/NADPH-dependent 2,4-dienoyl-CoA reductase/sulfur reductase-like enzyme
MAAAISLKNQGVFRVLVLEREAFLGGILPQCIHDGFGLIRFDKNLTGPEYADIYKKRLLDQDIAYETGCAVTRIESLSLGSDQPCQHLKKVTVVSAKGTTDYLAKAVILATGCREKPRGALGIPGTRPAGIFTAGTAQNFVNLRNLMPGKRVVILGSGDIGLIMARRLTLEGAEVTAVIERERTPGGLRRNVLQCLEDFEIPLVLSATITEIKGAHGIKAVSVCDLDSKGRFIEESIRDYPCDTLILSVGLIPEIETGLTAGIRINPETGEPIVNQDGQTSVAGIFVCGNARYVHDLVDDVSTEAEELGIAAARYIQGEELKDGIAQIAQDAQNTAGAIVSTRRGKSQSPDTITCLLCPNSCSIIYKPEISGAMCGRGEDYVKRELISPMRMLTSSVRVVGGEREIVSVRTTSGIPKQAINEAMKRIKSLIVVAPISAGEIIEKDFMTFGVDLIATSKVL